MIPLFFEVEWPRREWDAVIAVVADEALQMKRLAKRAFTVEEARQRIAAQLSCEEKARLADYVLNNNGSVEMLQVATEDLFARLLEKRNE